ncbi:MAG: pilin [Minisyncoccota bacterium]
MKKLLFITLFVLPILSLAQTDYTPLAPIPEITNNNGTTNINTFIPGAIRLTIGIASGLAVLFIIIGGIKYMSSDAWSKKDEGKKTIQNALGGLLLAIGSYVILNTVNPQLLNFNINIEGQSGGDTLTAPDGLLGVPGQRSAYDTGCIDNCTQVTNLPIKDPGACSNFICYLNSELIDKLKKVNIAMNGSGWQITEAFPPTVEHESSCHKPGGNAGKCADVALTDSSIERIRTFLLALVEEDLDYQYEVTSTARYQELLNAIELRPFRIVLNTNATGEHAHVEL